MKLSDLIEPSWCVSISHPDVTVSRVVADSRSVRSGDLFVAMPSVKADVTPYAEQAIQAGASAVLYHAEKTPSVGDAIARLGACGVRLSGSGQSFFAQVGQVCSRLMGDPTAGMRVIGVTGTNGKTTTAWMIRCALEALGRKPAYLGTLGINLGGPTRELSNTTPFPVELWQLIDECRLFGCTDLVMEVSSHALHQRRLAGVRFDCGIFTNLTQDHLDYHGSMEAYAEAKKLFFTEYAMASGKPFTAAINIADPAGAALVSDIPVPTMTFGAPGSGFRYEATEVSVDKIEMLIGDRLMRCTIPAGGLFNVSNSAAAGACLAALGYSDEALIQGLSAITPVPGRFESVKNTLGIGVLVDYAHTPDALEKVLRSARALKPRRLIAVFGCGGDRDRTKRPLMAGVASELADLTVVTSDNPRTEDAQSIVNEVCTGIKPGSESTTVVDRRLAIEHAVNIAEAGDIIVIAGKGHENYQIIGHTKHHMDDREMARDALRERGSQ